MVNKLILTPAGFKTYKLVEPFTVTTKTLGTITVPKDFETDLASTPRLLWSVIPPFGRYTQAAVVHDFLYRLTNHIRKDCDLTFYELMIKYKTYKWKAKLMYYAVRMFGGMWRG